MSADLSSFIHDARRFIWEFRSVIETEPLQIYNSALVFSPKSSIVRRQFSDQVPTWIENLPTVEETWSAWLQVLEHHLDQVNALTFSPDGQLLASASSDDTIRLWDPSTGNSRGMLEGHTGSVLAVTFLNDKLLASASLDGTVRRWIPSTGVLQGTLEIGYFQDTLPDMDRNPVLALSPHGRLLASASECTPISLWDSFTGDLRGTLKDGKDKLKGATFFKDQLLASRYEDGPVRLWNLSTRALHGTLHCGKCVSDMAFSSDGQLLAISSDNIVQLWNPTMLVLQETLGAEDNLGFISAVIFSPDSQLLAADYCGEIIRIWDLVTRTWRAEFVRDFANGTGKITFSPDGQLLVATSYDTIGILDPSIDPLPPNRIGGHSEPISHMAFSPDGQLLASASFDTTIRIWDPFSGLLRATLEGHLSAVTKVIFSPDGELLASESIDQTIIIWDPFIGVLQATLQGDSDVVITMVFSPNGQYLASGSGD